MNKEKFILVWRGCDDVMLLTSTFITIEEAKAKMENLKVRLTKESARPPEESIALFVLDEPLAMMIDLDNGLVEGSTDIPMYNIKEED